MKKSVLILLFFLMGNIAVVQAQYEFARGDGTPENPWEIASSSHLNEVRNYLDDHFILISDINLGVAPYNSGEGWEPIGTFGSTFFSGSFNGNGYAIVSLFINRPSTDGVGLFGRAYEAIIENVELINVSITGNSYAGGLVGISDATITDSYSTGTVSGNEYIGGLVGYSDGSVSNSHFIGTVSGNNNTGGLSGYNEASITDSYSEGDVLGNYGNTGGLVGINYSETTITNSYSTGTVSGYSNTGGLVGYNYNYATITNSHFTGTVSGDNYTGGLVGGNSNYAIIENSYSTATVSGNEGTGGLVGFSNHGYISNSYSTGTISGDSFTGGLVGYITNVATITNSYSTGAVSGNIDTGGLVGTNTAIITDSYSVGTVSGNEYVGGLVGYNFGSITNGYWNTETSEQLNGVGYGGKHSTGLTTAQMLDFVTFPDWDFENIWGIYDGFSFPFLRDVGNQLTSSVQLSGSEGWRMMASPVSGASLATLLDTLWTQGFTGADSPDHGDANVFTWDEASRSWSPPDNATDSLNNGTGFITYVYDDQDYDGNADGFPKRLMNISTQFTGSVSPTLSFTDTGTLADDGWNLVGNPYGATIDWDSESGWDKTNLDQTFYVWNDDADEYQSYNGFAGTTALANGLIAPWQGFWVKANADEPQLALTDDVRNAGGIFLKQHPKEPVPQLRFSLQSEKLTSSSVIMLSEEAVTGKDPLDAWKLQSLNAEYLSLFTQLQDGEALDINALPAKLDEPLEIALDLNGNDLSGEFELSWNLDALPEDWQFILRDNVTEEQVDLKEQSAISFQLAKAKSSKVCPEGIALRETLEDSQERTLSSPTHEVFAPKVLKAKTGSSGTVSRFTVTILSKTAVSNEPGDGLPETFALDQNYPNPFNPSTVIRYQLPVSSEVNLRVFDMLGREVATLINDRIEAGTHTITFDAKHLASGMYIYRLRAGNAVFTKKLTLIK